MSLLSYVSSFTVQAPADNIIAGVPIELLAVPGEILDVSNVEVVTGELDLAMLFKHVQLPPEANVNPWPAPAPAAPIANVTSGLSAAPQAGAIEGWLATITGTVPVGTRDISDQIQIDFRWLLTDVGSGDPLTDLAVLDGGLTADRLTFAVPPIVTDLTSGDFEDALAQLPEARRIGVQVVVRGRIGTTVEEEVTIPAAPLELPIVAIPLLSVAALFRNPDLAGDAVLVMVPENSPLHSIEDVLDVLEPLRNLLATVDSAATVTAWATGTGALLAAVDSLTARIPLTKHIGFREDDSHYDLGKYNFIVVDNWFDTDIEDRGSSCLLISASRRISFFQHDDYDGEELRLNALPQFPARFGGCLVRNLHVNNPGSEPPGCVITTGTPSGGTWGDVISSYRWSALRED